MYSAKSIWSRDPGGWTEIVRHPQYAGSKKPRTTSNQNEKEKYHD